MRKQWLFLLISVVLLILLNFFPNLKESININDGSYKLLVVVTGVIAIVMSLLAAILGVMRQK